MSKDEALKLALEALIANVTPVDKFEEAIADIREALAQPERHELQADGKHPAPCARFCEANAFQIEIRNLKAQLAQPEQSENSDFQPDWMNYQQGYMDGMSQAIADMALDKDKPQRTWVGLTDDEVHALFIEAVTANLNDPELIELIEAKLKEKNT